MSRIACLRIPKFQIVAHQKLEPELKNKPFVLLADAQKQVDAVNLSRAKIFMASPLASKKNVTSGMKWTEARATCAALTWRQCNHTLYKEEQNRLVAALITCSPRVSAREPGIFILDASGMTRLGGESKLCRDLLRLASKFGYVDGQAGIADSAFAALVATRFKKRWHIVPEGCDSKFMAPLSIAHLAIDYDLHDLFIDLGLKTMGDFAKLSLNSVAERFGNEVSKVQQLVLGLDTTEPNIPVPEKRFSAFIEVGGAMDSLNETIFLFKSLLDKITDELKLEGLCAEEILIQFFNEHEMFDHRIIKLVRPSHNTKFLLEVLRLSIEGRQLNREYTAIKIEVNKFGKEGHEQCRINEENDERDLKSQQNYLLQKFITRLGENSIVRPVPNDQFVSEKAGSWAPIFKPKNYANNIASPLVKESIETNSAVDIDYVQRLNGPRGLTAGLVLKMTPNPIPVFVELANGTPVAVTYLGKWHSIRQITAPECMSGLWWEAPFRKSYYTALIEPKYSSSSPLLVQLIHEHNKQAWFVEGVFD